MAITLHRETVDLGGGVRADLGPQMVKIMAPGVPAQTIDFWPRTRQEANRMSIALKKASRRLQAIGANLPEETPQGGE